MKKKKKNTEACVIWAVGMMEVESLLLCCVVGLPCHWLVVVVVLVLVVEVTVMGDGDGRIDDSDH